MIAHDTTAVTTQTPQLSRGFTITNNSNYQLRLAAISDPTAFEGHPDLGTTITPGADQHYEMTYWFMHNSDSVATYDVLDANGTNVGTVCVEMWVGGYNSPNIQATVTAGPLHTKTDGTTTVTITN